MSDLTIRTYRRRPADVQAVKVTELNLHHIVAWIGNRQTCHVIRPGSADARLLELACPDGIFRARPGDYIVRDELGIFRHMTRRVFEAQFERADAFRGLREAVALHENTDQGMCRECARPHPCPTARTAINPAKETVE